MKWQTYQGSLSQGFTLIQLHISEIQESNLISVGQKKPQGSNVSPNSKYIMYIRNVQIGLKFTSGNQIAQRKLTTFSKQTVKLGSAPSGIQF